MASDDLTPEGFDRRLRSLETVVNELRPKLPALVTLLADSEAIHQLVDDAAFGQRIRKARAGLYQRCGRWLAGAGALTVLIESILQLLHHG